MIFFRKQIHFLLVIVSQVGFSGVPDSVTGKDSSLLILRFAGDCLLAEHYEWAVGGDSAFAFDEFDVLRQADIAMVNLECPITVRGLPQEKPFTFRMNPRFIPALQVAGIDIVNLANNHIYDYGDIGLFDTISYLDSAGIFHVGAGKDFSAAHEPIVREDTRRTVAFLGYYGGGEAPAAQPDSPGVAYRSLGLIKKDIVKLRKTDSLVYIVVNVHWGIETAEHPEPSQIRFAHGIIDAGADAVIGHHPHVLQGIELYRQGVIAYSLGNFIFGGNSRDTYQTAVFEIRIEPDDVSYDLIPVQVKSWAASPLGGIEADSLRARVKSLSSIFSRSIFSEKE